MKDSDPLEVLLALRSSIETQVSEELVRACYQLQAEHQYDKDRDTLKKMQALVEEEVLKIENETLV